MLCDYGCGQEATHQFKNGKRCCSKFLAQCPVMRIKNGDGNRGKFEKGQHPNTGKEAWNKGIPRTEEEKALISRRTKEEMSKPENIEKMRLNKPPPLKKEKHPNWKGGYYNNNIPMYNTYAVRIYYAEECRRSPNDRNILQVKCAYCGKWFTPAVLQVYERIRALEGTNYGEQRLYCSEQCKQECPIFHQISYPKDHKPATSREVQAELRQMRFKADNYTCQKCKKHQDELQSGLHCHHIEGIRWEPLESADIDKVITLCKECHIKVHAQIDCGYNDMRCRTQI